MKRIDRFVGVNQQRTHAIWPLVIGLLLLLLPQTALADGTETLGQPSIPMESGTDIIGAGTGLETQPGTIDLDVPTGVTIKQVLLYWAGGAEGEGNAGDDTINVDGTDITGTLIGGPTYFFGDYYFSAYRADITALNMVDVGANSITVSGLDFSEMENGGAGIMVIFDDGTPSSLIDVRDGIDLAYFNFPEPRKSTVEQVFTFPAAEIDRKASLVMFFASVSANGLRPSSIEVTVGDQTTTFSNLLGSNDGPQWDTVDLPLDGPTITIPAGVTSVTIHAISRDDLGTGAKPASFSWIGTGLSISPVSDTALYSLGDRVWYDQNQDGIQDAGEPGVNDVTVELYANADCSGEPLATTTTANSGDPAQDGYYQFGDLSEGAYCVQFSDLPAGWSISPVDQGDGTNDSSADQNAQITGINLTADDPDEDMGIYVTGTLGDNIMCVSTGEPIAEIGVAVYADFNCDGTADGSPLGETSSDDTGFYEFTDLEVALAGDPNNQTCYVVEVDTEDADLGDCNIPAGVTVYNPQLTSSEPNDPDNDFVFAQPGSGEDLTLGDRVWYDQNQDGIQDATEPGYNGAMVNLYANADCSGEPLATTVTANGGDPLTDGFYQFTGLDAGTYCVEFTNLPAGWIISPADQGDGTNDSSADQNAQITGIDLTANDPDEDMGIYVTGTLGDTIMCATTNELLADIGVTLYADFNCDGSADGSALGTTATDQNGFYQFVDLEVALSGDANNQTCYVVEVETTDPDLGNCTEPSSQTSYNPELTSSAPDDPDNDFEFSFTPTAIDQGDEPSAPSNFIYIPILLGR